MIGRLWGLRRWMMGLHADQYFVLGDRRDGHLDNGQLLVLGQEQRSHQAVSEAGSEPAYRS
jgi:hypothetical protein